MQSEHVHDVLINQYMTGKLGRLSVFLHLATDFPQEWKGEHGAHASILEFQTWLWNGRKCQLRGITVITTDLILNHLRGYSVCMVEDAVQSDTQRA